MSAFPTINAVGVITQRPYGESTHFRTAKNDVAPGKRYARALWTAPTPGSPASSGQALRSFKVTYPVITRAEITVLENFFNSMRGRKSLFSFTDNDGVVHTACRFASDEFGMRYDDPGFHSVQLDIDEYIPGGAGKSIVSAVLYVTSSESVGVSYSGTTSIRVSFDGSIPPQVYGSLYSVTFLTGPYTGNTDTMGIAVADVFNLQVYSSLIGSLSGGAGNDTPANANTMTITDCHVLITFSDASTTSLYSTTSGQRLATGAGSFSTINCNHFNPLTDYSDFWVGGFLGD